MTFGTVDTNASCANTEGFCWTPIIVSSTVPVLDDSGTMGLESKSASYWASIGQPVYQLGLQTETVIQGHQLLQCGFQINNMKINVSAESRQPISAPLYKPASSWSNQTQLWPSEQYVSNDSRAYLVSAT